jgi:predicted GNAT family N-acyltransferase
MICTKQSFKKFGYGSALLDSFINKIKLENCKEDKDSKVKLVVSSLKSAVSYYQHYGFVLTNDKISDHYILCKYEKPETNEEHHILELVVS